MDENSILKDGKYKGVKIKDVPASYFKFQFENNKLNGPLKKYVAAKFYNTIP